MIKSPKLFRVLSLFVLSLSSLAAHAADEIGNNWLSIIQGLDGYGIKQVGTFNVRQFRSKAAGIRWYSMEQAPPSVLVGSRQSAVYFSRERKIFVNTNTFGNEVRVSLPQLELHELLGATGHDDSSYQFSTALNEIATAPSRAEAERLRQVYADSVFNAGTIRSQRAPEDLPIALRSGGSGTSISGGGDLNTIHVKAQVLKLVKSRGNVSNEFYATYPQIRFEPITAPGADQIAIEYTYESQRRTKKGYRESFGIYVPLSRWQRGAGAQQGIIEEIARKVVAIFPAYGRGTTLSYVPGGCDASRAVHFPYTDDPQVISIQRTRADFISDCTEIKPYKRSSTWPALPAEQMPRKPGEYHITCNFYHQSIGAQPYTLQGFSIAGRNELKSFGVGWQGAQSLNGIVRVDAKGNLTHIGIAFVSGDGVRQQPPLARADSADRASTQMVIDGSPLRFTCERN